MIFVLSISVGMIVLFMAILATLLFIVQLGIDLTMLVKHNRSVIESVGKSFLVAFLWTGFAILMIIAACSY